MTLENGSIQSGDPEIYFAIPNPPALELVQENLHISDKMPAIDFPHASGTTEILCEISMVSSRALQGHRTPPDFLAANERACDISPPYTPSEELCNRTAVGLQHSSSQFGATQGKRATSPQVKVASMGPRVAVAGPKLVFRLVGRPWKIWAPYCFDEKCILTYRFINCHLHRRVRRKPPERNSSFIPYRITGDREDICWTNQIYRLNILGFPCLQVVPLIFSWRMSRVYCISTVLGTASSYWIIILIYCS
ncbi:hypothetical protein DFH07DRAFT_939551, partial [Mycena maculata]